MYDAVIPRNLWRSPTELSSDICITVPSVFLTSEPLLKLFAYNTKICCFLKTCCIGVGGLYVIPKGRKQFLDSLLNNFKIRQNQKAEEALFQKDSDLDQIFEESCFSFSIEDRLYLQDVLKFEYDIVAANLEDCLLEKQLLRELAEILKEYTDPAKNTLLDNRRIRNSLQSFKNKISTAKNVKILTSYLKKIEDAIDSRVSILQSVPESPNNLRDAGQILRPYVIELYQQLLS